MEEFENIIVRSNEAGGLVRIKDIARVELGAQSYTRTSTLNGSPALAMGVFQTTGANALQTIRSGQSRKWRDFQSGSRLTSAMN